MNWLIRLLVNTIVLMVVAGYMSSFHLEGFGAAVIASMILSVLNVIVKPFLIILTLPVTIVTLGLFLLVVNAVTLWMTQAIMGDSFVIDGFGTAMFAALIISLLNLLIQKMIVDPLTEKKK